MPIALKKRGNSMFTCFSSLNKPNYVGTHSALSVLNSFINQEKRFSSTCLMGRKIVRRYTMINTLTKLGLTLSTFSLSHNAVAHSGISEASMMHSMLHIGTSTVIAIAFIAAGIVLLKRFPKPMKIRVKT